MASSKTHFFDVGTTRYTIERFSGSGSPSSASPVVVILHGVDGMDGASGAQIRDLARAIADDGYLVAVPHYFDAADGPSTLPLDQMFVLRVPRVRDGVYAPRVAAAVADTVGQPGADAGRVAVLGISLGGGLALDYAVSPAGKGLEALVDYFGFIANPAVLARASQLPPTLIVHNRKDRIVNIGVSESLVTALDATTVPHDHKFYDEDHPERFHHPFRSGGPADLDAQSRTLAWLGAHV